MKCKKHLIIILLIVGFNSTLCFSQGTKNKPNVRTLKANSVHVSPGILSTTLSYERKLWHPQKENAFFKTFAARFEGGLFRPPVGDCPRYHPLYIGAFSALTGRSKHHLEVGAGVSYMKDAATDIFSFRGGADFAINIGYRYQKPDGGFVFRFGASNPKYSYISLGIAF